MDFVPVQILNRRDKPTNAIYVGRPGRGLKGSPLANPFKMGSEADRERVIDQYRVWLWQQVQDREGPAWEELVRLAGRLMAGEELRLVCWCSPRRCHAEVINTCLLWMIRTGEI